MTPGYIVAFGGVLLFGLLGSIVIVVMRRPRRSSEIARMDPLKAEIDASLAEAEISARRAATEIAKVRASIAH